MVISIHTSIFTYEELWYTLCPFLCVSVLMYFCMSVSLFYTSKYIFVYRWTNYSVIQLDQYSSVSENELHSLKSVQWYLWLCYKVLCLKWHFICKYVLETSCYFQYFWCIQNYNHFANALVDDVGCSDGAVVAVGGCGSVTYL